MPPVWPSPGAASTDGPTGSAHRIFEKLEGGGKRFLSVVFVFSVSDDEVSFRWAGGTKTQTVPRKVWDRWEPEPIPNFKPRVYRK